MKVLRYLMVLTLMFGLATANAFASLDVDLGDNDNAVVGQDIGDRDLGDRDFGGDSIDSDVGDSLDADIGDSLDSEIGD